MRDAAAKNSLSCDKNSHSASTQIVESIKLKFLSILSEIDNIDRTCGCINRKSVLTDYQNFRKPGCRKQEPNTAKHISILEQEVTLLILKNIFLTNQISMGGISTAFKSASCCCSFWFWLLQNYCIRLCSEKKNLRLFKVTCHLSSVRSMCCFLPDRDTRYSLPHCPLSLPWL